MELSIYELKFQLGHQSHWVIAVFSQTWNFCRFNSELSSAPLMHYTLTWLSVAKRRRRRRKSVEFSLQLQFHSFFHMFNSCLRWAELPPHSSSTALLIRNGLLVHKYYINKVSPSQDYIKVLNCCFLSSFHRNMAWGFQMSYNSSSLLKRLQKYDLSKLDV